NLSGINHRQNPRVVTRVEAKYTERARQAVIEGTVTLNLLVGEQGIPTYITLYKGIDAELNQRAIEAAQQWRFYPATCNGKAVAAQAVIPVFFSLHGQPLPQAEPVPQPPTPEPVERKLPPIPLSSVHKIYYYQPRPADNASSPAVVRSEMRMPEVRNYFGSPN